MNRFNAVKKRKTFALFGIIVMIVAITVFIVIFKKSSPPEMVQTNPTPTPVATTATPVPTPTPIVYSETAPEGFSGFFEKTPSIGGQQGYVAYPSTIDPALPPTIVMYYHGSSQRITTNFSDEVMKNVRYMASEFTKKNFVFLASNQHGDNYGSVAAVQDSIALIDWVKTQYPIEEKIMILGFSMGGMPAMKHVLLHHTTIKKIALLAPATQVELYKADDFEKYRNVPLKVWHGTADKNVPYWVGKELLTYFTKKELPIELVTLDGKTHFQIDTEYTADIIDFFLKNSQIPSATPTEVQ